MPEAPPDTVSGEPAAKPALVEALGGKRVLITQADTFMVPTLCSVFAELGADVVADTRSLLTPEAAAAAVHDAGHIDVLLLNLAVPAPTTSAIDATDEEWAHVFGHMVDPMARLAGIGAPDRLVVVHHRSRHQAGLVAGQEGHGAGDLVGVDQPTEGLLRGARARRHAGGGTASLSVRLS